MLGIIFLKSAGFQSKKNYNTCGKYCKRPRNRNLITPILSLLKSLSHQFTKAHVSDEITTSLIRSQPITWGCDGLDKANGPCKNGYNLLQAPCESLEHKKTTLLNSACVLSKHMS